MNGEHFDALARFVSNGSSRRSFVRAGIRLLVSSPLAALGLGAPTETESKNKKGGKGKGKGKAKGKGKGKGKNRPNSTCVPGANDTFLLDAEELHFIGLINNHRAANGLAPLAHHRLLGAAARSKSVDMAINNYFAHDSPAGVTPDQNMRNHGYNPASGWAENIAAGSESAVEAFTQWQNSAGHNANMLDAQLSEFGIGCGFNAGSTWGWYWTTTFGYCLP